MIITLTNALPGGVECEVCHKVNSLILISQYVEWHEEEAEIIERCICERCGARTRYVYTALPQQSVVQFKKKS